MAAPLDPDAPSVFVGLADLAAREGVSKQAISKKLDRLIREHGLPVQRDARGRVCGVALAHYQHHLGQFANPAQAKVPVPSSKAPIGDSFEEARRQAEWLKVDDLKRRRAEDAGRLVRADRLAEALEEIGRSAQAEIMKLPNRADDLSDAVRREGISGLRQALRTVAGEIASRIADDLEAIAGAAPALDPALTDEEAGQDP